MKEVRTETAGWCYLRFSSLRFMQMNLNEGFMTMVWSPNTILEPSHLEYQHFLQGLA